MLVQIINKNARYEERYAHNISINSALCQTSRCVCEINYLNQPAPPSKRTPLTLRVTPPQQSSAKAVNLKTEDTFGYDTQVIAEKQLTGGQEPSRGFGR
jgi:hypothetical protein